VSEHSETLVELDLDYGELATRSGVPRYVRAPTVAANQHFIAGLAAAVRGTQAGLAPEAGRRICPAAHKLCPCAAAGARA
jgi:ferrochelatase